MGATQLADGSVCSISSHQPKKVILGILILNFAKTGLLVVDPPLSRYGETVVQADRKQIFIIAEEPPPYMGDFTAWHAEGPNLQELSDRFRRHTRTAIMNDIIAHWESSAILSKMADHSTDVTLVFSTLAKSIAVANWMTLLELVKMSIRNLEWRIDEKTREFDSTESFRSNREAPELYYSQKERLLHTFKIRWNEYREQVVNNMVQLGLSSTSVVGSTLQESLFRSLKEYTSRARPGERSYQQLIRQHENQRDWSYILWNLEFFISHAADLSKTMAVRVANLEGRKSNQLAHAAQRLAGLGIFFLPLGLAAGIFSMGGNFLPGKGHFWVYIVVGFPLVLGCLAIAFLPLMSWLKQVCRPWKQWKKRMQEYRKERRAHKHQIA